MEHKHSVLRKLLLGIIIEDGESMGYKEGLVHELHEARWSKSVWTFKIDEMGWKTWPL